MARTNSGRTMTAAAVIQRWIDYATAAGRHETLGPLWDARDVIQGRQVPEKTKAAAVEWIQTNAKPGQDKAAVLAAMGAV